MKTAAIIFASFIAIVSLALAGAGIWFASVVDEADPTEFTAAVTSCDLGVNPDGDPAVVAEVELTNLSDEDHRYSIVMDYGSSVRTMEIDLDFSTDRADQDRTIRPGETATIVSYGPKNAPEKCVVEKVFTY